MDYIRIGKIKNTHGLEGKVTIQHVLEGKNPFQKLKHVFIEINRESYIPFFIESKSKFSEDEILVSFDEIYAVEEARLILNKEVYLEKTVFSQLKPFHISESMVGYAVKDKNHGVLGNVESLVETPKQVIATVIFKEKEILLPLVEQTIVSIDPNKKLILLNLPEGLLDVYLEE